MEIRVPYGRTTVGAELPAELGVDVIELPETPAAPDPVAEVRRALGAPVGRFDWSRHAGAASVAIAVNDKTRPVPHEHLLPPLLEQFRHSHQVITSFRAQSAPQIVMGLQPDR